MLARLILLLLLLPGLAWAQCEIVMNPPGNCRGVFPGGLGLPSTATCAFGGPAVAGALCTMTSSAGLDALLLRGVGPTQNILEIQEEDGDNLVLVDPAQIILETNLTVTERQPASVAGNGTTPSSHTFTGAKGGNTTGTTGQVAGSGGGFTFQAGAGGDAPGGSTNGSGGSFTVIAGVAGVGAGAAGAPGSVAFNATGGPIHLDGRVRVTDQTVTLTTDNQAVTPTRGSFFLTSDNATSTDRTFTIGTGTPGLSGALLFLVWTHPTNEGELLSTGNVLLAGGVTWPPATNQQNDTLLLISDGTNWLEIARAAN